MRAALALACLLAAPATAETVQFAVRLGGSEIGRLTFDDGGGSSPSVSALFDNTPLGVADGTYEASSRPARTADGATVRQYIAQSSDRTISVLFDGPNALQTTIEPQSEATELSDPGRVPAGVIDPMRVLAQIVGASGCPAPFRLYDGRRVVEAATTGSETSGDTLTCAIDYRVTAGPGHVSPFRLTRLAITAVYDIGGRQRLQTLSVTAGGFTVSLDR